MAIFLMRGKFGSAEFPFIQKMKDFGINSGCTATQYGPGSPVSRGQAAVFLTPYAVY